MKQRGEVYFQISLMNVFRNAARERDAGKTAEEMTEDGRILSVRSLERREGASQATLREHLAQDLANLMATINLESTLPLDGLDHVRRSVLNFGMADLTHMTTEDVRRNRLANDLKKALLAHEPRLIAAFDITAEMAAKPVDVPLEFVAEIDTGVGKVALTNLTVR